MATSTSGMHLSRCTYVPLFLQTVKNILRSTFPHQSPSGPVYTRKTLQVFLINKTVWFENKNQTTRRKRLRIPSRTNLRSYIVYHSRRSTLPSRKKQFLATSTFGMHLSRRIYVPLFLLTVNLYIYIFQSHQSPSGPVYTRKTLQVFRNYRDWFEHENTFQNYQTKKATHTRALISCCAVALAQHLGRNCHFPQHSPKAMYGLPQHGVLGPQHSGRRRYCCR